MDQGTHIKSAQGCVVRKYQILDFSPGLVATRRPMVAFCEHIPWSHSLFVCGLFSFCFASSIFWDMSQAPDRLPSYYVADSDLELLMLLLPLLKHTDVSHHIQLLDAVLWPFCMPGK